MTTLTAREEGALLLREVERHFPDVIQGREAILKMRDEALVTGASPSGLVSTLSSGSRRRLPDDWIVAGDQPSETLRSTCSAILYGIRNPM